MNEKHILKRIARGLVPEAVLSRKKQPYRSPDAVCFLDPDAPGYVQDLFSDAAINRAGIFDSAAVGALTTKCRAVVQMHGGDRSLSNTDNMAIVGLLSAQLVHEHFISNRPQSSEVDITFTTVIDRLTGRTDSGQEAMNT